jgi:hypothetical protein
MDNNSEITVSDAPGVDIQLQESNLDWKSPGKIDADAFHKELKRINKLADMENEVAEKPVEMAETNTEIEEKEEHQAPESREDDADEETDSKVIPKKRLNKEIEKRKNLELELQKERDERVRYQTELDLYNKALDKISAKEQETKEDIDPVDEQAHNLYMRKIKELETKLELQTQALQTGRNEIQFANVVNAQQAEFSQKQPDFDEAYRHLVDTEIATAKLYGVSDAEAQQMATSKLYSLAQAALQKGSNVPEMFYNISKNYGYSGKNKGAPAQKGVNLDKIEKNIRASANPSQEVPAVSLKPAEDIATFTNMEKFEQRFMNSHGKGVNVSAFHDALRKLQGSV